MMKRLITVPAALLLLCALLCSTALAAPLMPEEGKTEDGCYRSGDFTFTLPEGFSQVFFDAERQTAVFEGKEDVNGFTPELYLYTADCLLDLDAISAEEEKAYIQNKLKCTRLMLISEGTEDFDGVTAKVFIFIYNSEDGRIHLYYTLYANIGEEASVQFVYNAHCAVRSLTEDLEGVKKAVSTAKIAPVQAVAEDETSTEAAESEQE